MKEFDPKHAKANGYTKADWDAVDAPDLTDDELATAKPLPDALPDLAAAMEQEVKRRGRPPLNEPKKAVSIRLEPRIIDHFKAAGRGWQTRVNDVLARHVDEAASRPGSRRASK